MAQPTGVGAALAAINEFVAEETAELPKGKYDSVNGVWPEGTNEGRAIKPTPQEAMSAAKRLYRVAMGKSWRGPMKLTTGRRHTSIIGGVFYVNPDHTWDGGWHGIVHSISHHASWRRYGENHGPRHAWIEKQLIEHVVSHGWLDGKLKRPTKPKADTDPKREKHARILSRIKSWQSKAKRAKTALAKLERQRRYYERQLAA